MDGLKCKKLEDAKTQYQHHGARPGSCIFCAEGEDCKRKPPPACPAATEACDSLKTRCFKTLN